MHRVLAMVGLMCLETACLGGQGPPPAVRPGIEVLLTDSLHLVRNRRVGLVANQGSVDASGVSEVERLRAEGVRLVALFSPEHGFRGTAAPGQEVASTVDSSTGLPIYSLYGRTSAPTDTMLDGIDLMVVDLPDVGARYYTYPSTMIEVMRAAARRRIPVVILDRPNPIGGAVQGNVLDTAYRSFVGMLAVPMRHGLTMGELARLARLDFGLTTDLTIVPVQGWHRRVYFDQTGLPFVPPSPNLRSVEALIHYPGLCLFEGTALSVGRGTDAPFEQIGAVWLDTVAVMARLVAARVPGVEFRSVRFTPHAPGDGKFADTEVAGVRLRVVDRSAYDPTTAAVTLLEIIQELQPDRIGWTPHFDRLAGGPGLREAIIGGRHPREIAASWQPDLQRYVERRKAVLLYPE